jgi:WD40 repeat protein
MNLLFGNFLERFDHSPENDHCDKVTAISSCSKLKLIATGSLDGTIRIWNAENQLIRYLDKQNYLRMCGAGATSTGTSVSLCLQ